MRVDVTGSDSCRYTDEARRLFRCNAGEIMTGRKAMKRAGCLVIFTAHVTRPQTAFTVFTVI